MVRFFMSVFRDPKEGWKHLCLLLLEVSTQHSGFVLSILHCTYEGPSTASL